MGPQANKPHFFYFLGWVGPKLTSNHYMLCQSLFTRIAEINNLTAAPDYVLWEFMRTKKEYYYLDKINFELIAQEKDKTINLNSSVLSDATLKNVLDDIEKNLKKTNKKLM